MAVADGRSTKLADFRWLINDFCCVVRLMNAGENEMRKFVVHLIDESIQSANEYGTSG